MNNMKNLMEQILPKKLSSIPKKKKMKLDNQVPTFKIVRKSSIQLTKQMKLMVNKTCT
jgi:hypothetical protein